MVHLFLKTYRDPSPERNAEMARAVSRNKYCRHIDRVVQIAEPAKITVRVLLKMVRHQVGWADVVIIANGDIYFDDTAVLLNHIGYDECFALSRYEEDGQLCENPQGSQSSWVFRGPPPDVPADFGPYEPGADHRFNYLLQQAGYAIYNPSLSIKSHHLHASQVRYYDPQRDKLPGPGLLVPPSRIEHIRHRPSDPIRKPGKVAIIQPERFGDIVNVLPIAYDLARQGHEVTWYVTPEYAPLLEGVSYVAPMIWDRPADKPLEAIDHAKSRGFDLILTTTANGNPLPSPQKTRSFATEEWARAGYLDKFHILPCVFDRPHAPVESWKPAGTKPILAYCFDARTSPYPRDLKQRLIAWLHENFAGDFEFLPIDPSLGKPDALAVVLRQVKVLISVDTFPLHMSYAAGTPTIAITAKGWNISEPRRNWILQLSYGDTGMADGLEKIAAALRATLAGSIQPSRLIVQPQNMPSEPPSHLRLLSILIPASNAPNPALRILLDGLITQVHGHHEIEVIVDDMHDAKMLLWQKRNNLLKRASGEYSCFIDVGDNVGPNYIQLITQALADRPDCVGFKVGYVADGKVQSVEIRSSEAADGSLGINHLSPIKTHIARKIAFASGADEEFAAKLADSGLLETENFIDAVIYARPVPKR
jgi:hypothetical protein